MRKRPLWGAAAVVLAVLTGNAAVGAGPAPAECPATDVRPDVSGRWIDGKGNLRWPTSDWTSGIITTVVLPPGMVIDRFGCETGRDFNPQGTAFAARALPYVCSTAPYSSYRVVKPLVAWSGKAPAWFDQKGGGLQFRTTATAAQLVAEGSIEIVEAERPSCG
jgi:hypothetical protein